MPYAQQLETALKNHPPTLLSPDGRPMASVAMILADAPQHGADLLLIKRAQNPGDPWSGHLAFPGGRVDPADPSRRGAAEREAMEEVGLDLNAARAIGQLSDMGSAGMPIIVSAFVYHLPRRVEALTLQASEVAAAKWIPFPALLDENLRTQHHFVWKDQPMTFPAIDLYGPDEPVLWGLTYAFVAQALGLMGHQLPVAW